MSEDRFEFEQGRGLEPVNDDRPRVPEPLPVRLVAVADVTLPATAGLDAQLEAFYVGVLEFVREPPFHEHVYRADNFRLRFDLHEGLFERDGYRPLGVEVPSLAAVEEKLLARKIEYTKHRGLMPGDLSVSLFDPAGNLVELVEARRIL